MVGKLFCVIFAYFQKLNIPSQLDSASVVAFKKTWMHSLLSNGNIVEIRVVFPTGRYYTLRDFIIAWLFKNPPPVI